MHIAYVLKKFPRASETFILNEILARHCNKTVEEVKKDTDRDYFLSAQQALEYGLVDQVVSSLKK